MCAEKLHIINSQIPLKIVNPRPLPHDNYKAYFSILVEVSTQMLLFKQVSSNYCLEAPSVILQSLPG
jgi:hypothetical protein